MEQQEKEPFLNEVQTSDETNERKDMNIRSYYMKSISSKQSINLSYKRNILNNKLSHLPFSFHCNFSSTSRFFGIYGKLEIKEYSRKIRRLIQSSSTILLPCDILV